jgi:NAD(P)-dependent dehydrogenase (short-subunit alcohol dehydrogenase family)
MISGASSGIGRHCALCLAKAGFKVIAGVRSEKAGNELEKASSGELKAILLDVTDSKSIKSATQIISTEYLYAIVNNAGIAVFGPLEFIPIDEIRRQFDVNLFGHITVTQAMLPYLRRNGGGRIINISSISGIVAFPMCGPYAASKFALQAFNDSLRRELKQWNIQVISIQPGNIRTSIWDKTFLNATAIAEKFPAEADIYYKKGPIHTEIKNTVKMTDPSTVSHAVRRALTVRRPKNRYLVGMDARKYVFLNWILPNWLFERII